jgi:hypothetical protein
MARFGLPSGRKTKVGSPKYSPRQRNILSSSDAIRSSDEFKSHWSADEEITEDDEMFLLDMVKRHFPNLNDKDALTLMFTIKNAHNSAREIEDGEAKRWGIGVKDKPFNR